MRNTHRGLLRRAAARIARAGEGASPLPDGRVEGVGLRSALTGHLSGRVRPVRDAGFPLPDGAPRQLPRAALAAYLARYGRPPR